MWVAQLRKKIALVVLCAMPMYRKPRGANKPLEHLVQEYRNLILDPRHLSRKLQLITTFISSIQSLIRLPVRRGSQENIVYSRRMVLEMHNVLHLLIAGRVNTGKPTVAA